MFTNEARNIYIASDSDSVSRRKCWIWRSSTWDQGTQTNVFSAVKKDVVVAENGDISFPMTEGGTYLVSAKPVVSHEGELEEMLFQVEYEQRGDYDELLTYLKDDPNGYFTNLWEAPGHIAAEDED